MSEVKYNRLASQAAQREHIGADKSVGADKSDFLQNLTDAVRENPVSAALITMGAVWLFSGSTPSALFGGHGSTARRPSAPEQPWPFTDGLSRILPEEKGEGRATESFSSKVKTQIDRLSDRANQAATARVASATEAASSVSDALSSAKASTGAMVAAAGGSLSTGATVTGGALVRLMADGQDDLKDAFERYPLLIGAVGLALGAGIAASLPTTDVEGRLLGEKSDNLKEEAQSIFSDQLGRAQTLVEDTFEELKREAHAQGFSEAGASGVVQDYMAKMTSVAATVKDSIQSELGLVDKA